jgi:hypothetical protein
MISEYIYGEVVKEITVSLPTSFPRVSAKLPVIVNEYAVLAVNNSFG